MVSRLWLAGWGSMGMLSASPLWAGWAATGTANEYSDGYWTITLSGNALSKVTAGGSDAAALDFSSFEADTGIRVTSIDNGVCQSALIASFIGPDVTAVGQSAFLNNSGVKRLCFRPS